MHYLTKLLGTVLAVTVLAGCTQDPNQSKVDQCMRQDLFIQCLKSLPAGPTSTMYNDWDEVLKECQSAAYYHSLRKLHTIKLECRS